MAGEGERERERERERVRERVRERRRGGGIRPPIWYTKYYIILVREQQASSKCRSVVILILYKEITNTKTSFTSHYNQEELSYHPKMPKYQ